MQELNKAIDDIRSKGELSNGITTRYAVPEDAKRLLEIYAPYVENTAITFEYDVPTLEEFIERIRHTLEKYPYIVALNNGQSLVMRMLECSTKEKHTADV